MNTDFLLKAALAVRGEPMRSVAAAIRSAVEINRCPADETDPASRRDGAVAINAIHTAVIGIASRLKAVDPSFDRDAFVKACGTLGEPAAPKYRAQQEANGKWSVYRGQGYLKGPFYTEPEALAWIGRRVADDASVAALAKMEG